MTDSLADRVLVVDRRPDGYLLLAVPPGSEEETIDALRAWPA